MRESLPNDLLTKCACGKRPKLARDEDGLFHVDCDCGAGLSVGSQELAVERWNNPRSHLPICKRVKVATIQHMLPIRYIEALEQNQKISSCCRHPENHEIEALRSNDRQRAPDIYIFHCTCGRKHRRFCVGQSSIALDGAVIAEERRPVWDAR